MVSRGYVPGAERGSLKEMKLGVKEYVTLGFIIVLLIYVYYTS